MNRKALVKTRKRAAKPSEISETLLFTGLCATCGIVDGCVSAKNSGYPVVECEEYAVDGRTFSETVKVAAPSHTRKAVSAPQKSSVALECAIEGLCGTCALKSDCTFPKLEGGVWHCEEYR